MGTRDYGLSGDGKIVYLFAKVAEPTQTSPVSPFPFFEFGLSLQKAFAQYNLALVRMASDYARDVMDACLPLPKADPIIVADKDWLAEKAAYGPFLKSLETDGQHCFASYTSALAAEGEAILPATFVYNMNVARNGGYIEIFHGDSAARSGSLLEMEWQEKAAVYALALYEVREGTPVRIGNEEIVKGVSGILSGLVHAINHQNRQIYERNHPSLPLHRRAAAHLHLVS